MIEADDSEIEEVAKKARAIMMRATELVVGRAIPVKSELTGPGRQFYDKDGEEGFRTLMGMLEEAERRRAAA